MPFRPIPSFNSFLYAVISIVLTGIIFGLVPAYKASKGRSNKNYIQIKFKD